MFDYKAQLDDLKKELDMLQKHIKDKLNSGDDPTELCRDVRHVLKRLSMDRDFVVEDYLGMTEEEFRETVRTLLTEVIGDNLVADSVIQDSQRVLDEVGLECPSWRVEPWDQRVARDAAKMLTAQQFVEGLVLKEGVFYRAPWTASEGEHHRTNKKIASILTQPPKHRRIVLTGIEVIVEELKKPKLMRGD